MFAPPDISYFNIMGFPIYYYGIILAFSIFVGLIISNQFAIKEYFLTNFVPQISTSTIIGGIVGARLYYCILNSQIYFSDPAQIFAIREGGLSIHGAILGGLTVLYIYSKRYHIRFLKVCDIFAIGMPIAQAIGRWGNFFNSEAFGLPTNLPWGLYVKPQYRPTQFLSNEYFHPTFLYESVLDIVIFFVLIKFISPRYKDTSGIISASYLLLYSIVRIMIESLRIDCVKYCFGIPFPIIISIIITVLSCLFIIKTLRK